MDDEWKKPNRRHKKDKGHEPPLEELKEEKIGDTEVSNSPRRSPKRGVEGPFVMAPDVKANRKSVKVSPRNSLTMSQKWQRSEDSGLSGIMESSEK